MTTLTITQGYPGSGKSTWAKKQLNRDTIGINRDYLRIMTGGRWFPANEGLVTSIQQAAIIAAKDKNLNVILDDTFLNLGHLKNMQYYASGLGFDVSVKSFMDVPLHECIKRDAARERSVGKDVIEGMYYRYWEQFTPPENAGEEAIIVDIDGTLSHTNIPYPAAHDRDYSKDWLDPAIASLVKCMYTNSYKVIIVSGRDFSKRAATIDWLATNKVPYDYFYSRSETDSSRSDELVKKDLYMDNIQGNFHVEFVVDDRPRVVRMWRAELGLKVMNVGLGSEF